MNDFAQPDPNAALAELQASIDRLAVAVDQLETFVEPVAPPVPAFDPDPLPPTDHIVPAFPVDPGPQTPQNIVSIPIDFGPPAPPPGVITFPVDPGPQTPQNIVSIPIDLGLPIEPGTNLQSNLAHLYGVAVERGDVMSQALLIDTMRSVHEASAVWVR